MMYAYLIHLSRHLWDDSTSLARGLYLSPDYTENNNTDLATWDEVIQGLARYGFNTVVIDVCDALQYESHPEISAPDAWSKEFLKKKLDEIRALGMEPIPKLNFSAALAKDRLDPALFKGFIVAPWLPTRKTERLALLSAAEKMWYARQDFFPETL